MKKHLKRRFLPSRLRFHRRAQDLTQKVLAEKVGIDQTYYSYIERGYRVPKIDLAWRICQVLDVSINEVFPAEIFEEAQ